MPILVQICARSKSIILVLAVSKFGFGWGLLGTSREGGEEREIIHKYSSYFSLKCVKIVPISLIAVSTHPLEKK